jgi:hypothetical protein
MNGFDNFTLFECEIVFAQRASWFSQSALKRRGMLLHRAPKYHCDSPDHDAIHERRSLGRSASDPKQKIRDK